MFVDQALHWRPVLRGRLEVPGIGHVLQTKHWPLRRVASYPNSYNCTDASSYIGDVCSFHGYADQAVHVHAHANTDFW